MQKILFFIALFTIAFASCKKEVITPTKTSTEKLLHNGAAWKLKAATVDPALPLGGTLVTDYFAQLDDCDKDDGYLYSANPITATSGSVILKNPVRCDNTEKSEYAGTWSFNADATELTTNFGTNPSLATIVELSETTLKTKRKVPIDKINYIVTFTYE